jgi:uncharacterized protein YbbK (DUF523 family)
LSSAKKRVIISACILGEYCRYDGKTKEIPEVLKHFEGYEVVPFCPEAPLFGTPRERIDVVLVDGEKRILTHEGKKDVTELLRKQIEDFCEANPHADAIVLKSKSPSCGYKTTPLLDEDGKEIAKDNGIAADIFLQRYADISIVDENHFLND